MPNLSHHQAAEANIKDVSDTLNRTNGQTMTVAQAQNVFTAQLALATLANTQALLAINETLRKANP